MFSVSKKSLGSPPQDCETDLLRLCARVEVDQAIHDRIARLVARGIDWQLFLELARLHKVLPLTHNTLRKLPSDAVSIPPDVSRTLAVEYLLNAKQNRLLAAELCAIARRFGELGVEVLPIKGVAVAEEAYGSIELRQSGDLDIIVKAADVEQASDELLAMKFRVPDQVNADGARFYKNQRFLESASGLRQYQFYRADGVLVELHWELGARHFPFALNSRKLWAYAVPGKFMDAPVAALPPIVALLLLTHHGSKHGWTRLCWICDIAEFVRVHDDLDWEALFQTARSFGMTKMVGLALRLAADFLDAPLPQEARRLFSAGPRADNLYRSVDYVHRAILDPSKFEWHEHQFGLTISDRLIDRLRYGSSILMTPTAEEWMSVELPERYSGLYSGVRLLRVARLFAASRRN